MTEIPISEIRGIRIGQVENADAGTGCTVLICEDGMRAGVDIRGGGPASRETPLLNPLMAAQIIHAIVLGGGSAFGLGAANGVMKYREERKIGFDVGVTKVPLVVQRMPRWDTKRQRPPWKRPTIGTETTASAAAPRWARSAAWRPV